MTFTYHKPQNTTASGTKTSRRRPQDLKRSRSRSPEKETGADQQKWRRTINNYDVSSKKTTSQVREKGKGGLNVELHPLLSHAVTTSTLPTTQNPLRGKRRGNFDLHAINPYLNQEDIGEGKHRQRPLQLNDPGKYVRIAALQRNEAAEREKEQQVQAEKKAKGLAPIENLGEHFYIHRQPPQVEWWDKPFLKDNNYRFIDDESRMTFENPLAPISMYIEHPVLVTAPAENLLIEAKPMHLTKDEQKRVRRNERQERHKEKQDRIRLGLDPPPAPKVKLANLMNVLTNESIKDPTAVEARVRQEVEQRYLNHMKENEARKLTPEQRHEKEHESRQKDMQKGLFAAIFRVDKLENPQHSFKIDMNAKQLELVGICLKNPKFNLIIVEGGSKAIKFYKKLMLHRIKWTESVQPKHLDEPPPDLTNNMCQLLWEGQIMDVQFQKWSVMYTRTDDEAYEFLNRFNAENYWREAAAMLPDRN